MTPLSLIEKGILAGDWKNVCAGFNKLTGKNIEPPKAVAPKVEPVFNPQTAKKPQLYKKLLELNENLAPAKAYTLEDLREMWTVYQAELEETVDAPQSSNTGATSIPVLDGFRYVKDPNRLLFDDKKSIRVSEERALAAVQDNPDFERKIASSRPTKVKAKCIRCKTQFNTYKTYTNNVDGELVGVCDVCKESK